MTRNRPEFAASRREWLRRASTAILLASAAGPASSRRAIARDRASVAEEAERVAGIQAQAKKAGLAPFGYSWTEHFLGVGDAPDAFRDGALEICEALGRVFLKHLRDRGLPVDFPDERMMVVVLKDAISYGALVGEAPGKDVGGHFDLDADRLVVFDFRPEHGAGGAAERINTFTLVHETTHLLCFNTGLLALRKEPPKCVTEGLATYFEMWRRSSRVPVGGVNRPRLEAIRAASRTDEPWIELPKLLTDDALFDRPATAQLAYGQSWLLMYNLLSSRSLRPNLAAYLADLRTEAGPDRLATFEKRLGPIAAVEDRLRREARAMLRDVR
ncbi:DUF1570 domain-containing protein [Planctomyces sp. SH-PL62]|uniref:DUF1570 domain-containing protein n=1 Tax=Planctomyces sp. SH-PL62 TaxID=1636152 RepID=UPI00078D4754|nr:DUF1570 domain-containing protein [Planctomyces sp. SH-PL62]AMV39392.1 hypothetical protein VT85_18285 [Planctomyces sp. SH-PL62]